MSTFQLVARVAIVVEHQGAPAFGAVTLCAISSTGSCELTGVNISMAILAKAFLLLKV